jgi:hypothetical protein
VIRADGQDERLGVLILASGEAMTSGLRAALIVIAAVTAAASLAAIIFISRPAEAETVRG